MSAWRWLALLVLGLVGTAVLYGCVASGTTAEPSSVQGDLIIARSALHSAGVTHPDRASDGVTSEDGDFWRTDATSLFSGSTAALDYDLGKPTPIHFALLQADNDDRYTISISDDGAKWKPLWVAEQARGHGMQTRLTESLNATTRYVRVTASGGDGNYALSEVAVWSERPGSWPPKFGVRKGMQPPEQMRFRLQVFAAAAILFLIIHTRRVSKIADWLAVVPVAAGIWAGLTIAEFWPVDETVQTYIRAIVAAIAGVALMREYYFPPNMKPWPRWTNWILGVMALLAVACYYHLGMPQFRDEAKGRPTFVHPWDMRVYFPLAKYFNELHFDGLYWASVAAYLDNNPGVTPQALGRVKLRDLRDNQMRTVPEVIPEIQGVRTRFTAERWDEFKKDMKYFQDLMGGGYLSSLGDHGGNATPVWILGAHMLFRWAPANELTLTLSGLIDPLLLILMFYAISRTFGVRAMLVTLIIWGTTDFSRFGTNLMGSTLRADWMVALGFGACALKSRKWVLGGALIAYSGLIRAFPAVASLFLAVPTGWWLYERIRASKRFPSLADFKKQQMPFLRTAFGVLLCVGALFAVSSALFSYQDSWGNWFQKITIHAEKPNVNHVGLRNVLSFEPEHVGEKVLRRELPEPWTDWQVFQLNAFARRKPIFYLTIAVCLAMAAIAARKKRFDQAALLGLFFIPILFYPANYYCHYVFLLPLIALGDRDEEDNKMFAWLGVAGLAMCVALYPTLEEHWSDVCFTKQSFVLLAGFAAMLVPLARANWLATHPKAAVAAALPAAGAAPPGPSQPAAPATSQPAADSKPSDDATPAADGPVANHDEPAPAVEASDPVKDQPAPSTEAGGDANEKKPAPGSDS